MTAIKRVSLSEQVYSSILEYVAKHNLQTGDKLPTESELANLFQVSRTSIREAVKALSISGALTSVPGKGTFISPAMMSFVFKYQSNPIFEAVGYISQVMEVRTAVELLVGELSVERATIQDIQNIEESLQDLKEAVNSGKPWALEGARFHILLAESTKNPLIVSLIESYSKAVGRYRDTLVEANTDFDMDIHLKQHDKILEALKERNNEKMIKSIKDHMETTEKNLKRLVNENSASEFIIN